MNRVQWARIQLGRAEDARQTEGVLLKMAECGYLDISIVATQYLVTAILVERWQKELDTALEEERLARLIKQCW